MLKSKLSWKFFIHNISTMITLKNTTCMNMVQIAIYLIETPWLFHPEMFHILMINFHVCLFSSESHISTKLPLSQVNFNK